MIDFKLNKPKIKLALSISKKYCFIIIKNIYHKFIKSDDKQIVFIVGCQRSGTTLMSEIFEKDLRTKVYGEFSHLSNKDKNKIRLNPLEDVKKKILKDKSPLIVIKPLVETQNILKILNFFPNSKAIFMYRNFRDVTNSNLKKFGIKNGINDLKPIVSTVVRQVKE